MKLVIVAIIVFLLYALYVSYGKRGISSLYQAQLSTSEDYIIPRVCHQTWHTKDLAPGIKSIIKQNKMKNLNMRFKLYDNKECDLYIHNNFSPVIYQAYQKINPKYGAARADFFRYCILYNEGGVYLDIKSRLTTKLFGNIIKPNDICVLDIKRKYQADWRFHMDYGTYGQWLLMFAKGHLYLKNMISLMVETIHNDTVPTPYGLSLFSKATSKKEQVMRMTGPDAFAVAIHKSIITEGIRHREVSYKQIGYIAGDNYLKLLYRKSGRTHYSQLTEPILVKKSHLKR